MIRIFEDMEALSLGAVELFVRRAGVAAGERGMFSAALSGGHTPRRTYELLALPPWRDQVPWERTAVFWSDERCVPAKDHRSNSRMAFETLLNHVPISPDRIHPIACDEDPDRGAEGYENLLRTHFSGLLRFDLIFLGLGENGHTASLFPQTTVLREEKRAAAPVRVQGEDFHRVTLTAPAINRAAAVVFLVSGRSKARVLREVIEGPRDTDRLPAQLIRPVEGELLWLVDRAAAAELKDIQDKEE